ncbi:MAG: hypothetical protein JW984_13030 [Deltaproteobacteria bacterium]|uniref:Restriction endonuclease n=1 Tax=Candidatus Zymogenus saltonus TaxID=2844893 RepID=A0A9D8PQC7_9DELT|nr:hypothetical protein [Candidatus Zymogenus saltonus]
MSEEYGTHAEYISWVLEDAKKRQAEIESYLKKAFSSYIEIRSAEVIIFSDISALDLADIINDYPLLLKPLTVICNIAGRSIERDLQIKNVNTYNPKLSKQEATAIAGYIKPFLPSYLELSTLSNIDRTEFVDKEIRKIKGRWEKRIVSSLNRLSPLRFKKRQFTAENEKYEIDAACPEEGAIKYSIDIKRIEARRDIHKRIDEIINKSNKLKSAFPQAKFAAIIYYPFIEEQINIHNRLSSENIDVICFASDSKDSIFNAVKMVLSSLGVIR